MLINNLKNDPDLMDVIYKVRSIISRNEKDEIQVEFLIDNLLNYGYLLYSWGMVHNIISKKQKITDILENILDSIFQLDVLKEIFSATERLCKHITDAGAGGGLPGIPLAVVFPKKKFLLIDSNRKKCSFLRSIKAKMHLYNISIVNKSIENIEPSVLVITKAAFSPKNSGVLAGATSCGGNLAIWATPKTSQDFVDELAKFGVLLNRKLDYNLPSGKERSLLIFVKA